MQDNSIKFSPIKDRILLFAEYKGITPNKIYIESGMTRGVLGQKNGISELNLSKFLDAYPEVNVNWLLTGIGEISKNAKKGAAGNTSFQEQVSDYGKNYERLYYEVLEENRALNNEIRQSLNLRLENFENYVNKVFARIGKKREDINLGEIKKEFFKDDSAKTAS